MSTIDQLLNEEVVEFMKLNRDQDLRALALKYNDIAGTPIAMIIDQMTSREKAESKLPCFSNVEGVVFPAPLSIEQSSSESTAEYKSTIPKQSDTLVDLTGGAGIDAWQFSKRFKRVIYVERSAELCKLASHNFRMLGLSNIEVENDSAESFVDQLPAGAVVYVDPSRRDSVGRKFKLEDCEPNIIQLLPKIWSRSAEIMIKASPILDISQALTELPEVSAVHIVSIKNEVKELIFHLIQGQVAVPEYHCIDLRSEDSYKFDFTKELESNAQVEFSLPDKYIYEPMAAIMKAGGFRIIAERFSLSKLAPSSHFYTSSMLSPHFPGRCFELIETLSMKEASVKISKANIISRNFPLNAEAIRKKLKIESGGDAYLIATTLVDKRKVLLHLRRLR